MSRSTSRRAPPPPPTTPAPAPSPSRDDVLNRFAVAAGVGPESRIVILNLPLNARRGDQVEGSGMPQWPVPGPLTADEAINLAAWLVAVSGKRGEFLELLEAVMRT